MPWKNGLCLYSNTCCRGTCRSFMTSTSASCVRWPRSGLTTWSAYGAYRSLKGNYKRVCMAHLAIVGSHSVNGVSELQSRLLQASLVPDFYQLWPERFNNKTNG